MRVTFYGDSLTEGIPGASYFAMLCERLPEHTFINAGEGDDTAYSLRRRILEHNILTPVDLAFVWIGTNDIPFKISPAVALAKRLRNKPWSNSPDEFRDHYRKLLRVLLPITHDLITVSPVLVGEDRHNAYNAYLDQLNAVIEEESAVDSHITYLDLRPRYFAHLDSKPISTYMPGHVGQTLADAIYLRTLEQIDQVSTERGLHLTVDGIHFNSAGASIAADAFEEIIRTRVTGQ